MNHVQWFSRDNVCSGASPRRFQMYLLSIIYRHYIIVDCHNVNIKDLEHGLYLLCLLNMCVGTLNEQLLYIFISRIP